MKKNKPVTKKILVKKTLKGSNGINDPSTFSMKANPQVQYAVKITGIRIEGVDKMYTKVLEDIEGNESDDLREELKKLNLINRPVVKAQCSSLTSPINLWPPGKMLKCKKGDRLVVALYEPTAQDVPNLSVEFTVVGVKGASQQQPKKNSELERVVKKVLRAPESMENPTYFGMKANPIAGYYVTTEGIKIDGVEKIFSKVLNDYGKEDSEDIRKEKMELKKYGLINSPVIKAQSSSMKEHVDIWPCRTLQCNLGDRLVVCLCSPTVKEAPKFSVVFRVVALHKDLYEKNFLEVEERKRKLDEDIERSRKKRILEIEEKKRKLRELEKEISEIEKKQKAVDNRIRKKLNSPEFKKQVNSIFTKLLRERLQKKFR